MTNNMQYRPAEENKKLAANVAGRLYEHASAGDDIFSCHGQLKFFRQGKSVMPAGKTVQAAEDHVGIWKETSLHGKTSFIRDEKFADDFVYWARAHEIKPKANAFRVVLLGESAARGFLVDPFYNPSMALEKILGCAGLNAEVVDLARTNCSIGQLIALVKGCVRMEPDALVVFAGNNWTINGKNLITPLEIRHIINTIVGGNSEDVIRNVIEEKLSASMQELFRELAAVKERYAIPVVIVNPEFNCMDWKSNETDRLPSWTTNDIERWYALLSKATGSIQTGDFPAAEALCNEMIGMHPFNPAGYELLAKCRYIQGDKDGAAAYLRSAHDTSVYQAAHCPGVTSFIQNWIRREVRDQGFCLVDLPVVFHEHLEGDIAGRTLFLDYCHLTVEGINLAMYHAARALMSSMSVGEWSVDVRDTIQLGPDDISCAAAHFLAAIHNAHWGQGQDIVAYHCRRSLSYFDISNEMMQYVYMTTSSQCPWRLNRHFESLVSEGIFMQYLLLSQPEEGLDTFDLTLVDGILTALRDKQVDVGGEVNTMRVAQSGEDGEGVDLLQSCHWVDGSYNPLLRLKMGAYYKEFNRWSKFYLLYAGSAETRVELVHRVPYNSEVQETLELEINGTPFYSAPTGPGWSRIEFEVPSHLLRYGVNNLIIRWPLRNIKSKYHEPVEYADLELYYKYMFPLIGEIHSLTIKPANRK